MLETADGRALGRTGPLIGAAARSDFLDVLVNAVLSIEDRRFYRHVGVDPQGILRAARANLGAGKIVEGGSTITQQLVKLRGAGREQTMERKLREAFAALWLDFRMDKDAILTEYLNRDILVPALLEFRRPHASTSASGWLSSQWPKPPCSPA